MVTETMMKKFISLLTLCVFICSSITGCAQKPVNEDVFTNWVDGSESLSALKEYVETVTDEKSENFIPVVDRIAVFDLDGTLYCETFPIYGEWLLFSDYVLNTPGYEASDDLMAVAQELAEIKKASDIPSHMEQTHIHAHAEAFAGMTIEDYMDVVEAFKETYNKQNSWQGNGGLRFLFHHQRVPFNLLFFLQGLYI